MRKLFGILLAVILALTIAVPALASTESDPLVRVDSNIVVREKAISALDFYGDITYETIKFVFCPDGGIAVSKGDYSYHFIPPFASADPHALTIETYQNSTQVVRTYTLGTDRNTVSYLFDFAKYEDRVLLDFTGRVQTDTLDIEIMAVKGKFKAIGKTAWVGEFDEETGEVIAGVGFDWNDAVQSATVDDTGTLYNRVKFAVGKDKQFTVDPSVVGTTTGAATYAPFQRKAFYANGRHWVFYSDGTDGVWRTSLDGSSWSAATTFRGGLTGGDKLSVNFDGIYLHYAAYYDFDIFYRRGTPNAGGTITWSVAEQKAYNGSWGYGGYRPSVIVDSGGYPWIGYYQEHYAYGGYYTKVTKSSTNDGTWSTASGFPHSFDFGSYHTRVGVVPLTSSKVYAVHIDPDIISIPLKGTLWNGSSWGSEETIASAMDNSAYFSAVSLGDVVYVTYLKPTSFDIAFRERSAGGSWGSEVIIQASTTTYSAPVISLWNSDGDLIVYWAGSPSADHIYYKKRVSGSWDADPTDYIDETTDDLTSCAYLTSFLQHYPDIVGLVYMTKTGSPYDIKYAFIVTITAPSAEPEAASDIAKLSAQLNAVVVDDGGESCEVRFGYGTANQTVLNFLLYDTITAWDDSFVTGNHPYYNADNLTATTLYYYRAQIKNSDSTVTSVNEENFTTLATVSNPSNFRGMPSATSVSLIWVKGAGSTNSMVRYKFDSYPSDNVTGALLYDDTGNTVEHTGLDSGTNIYYRVWGYSGGDWSAGYDSVMITTLAGEAEGEGFPTPPEPAGWMQSPDPTVLANVPILYNAVNGVADAYSMPRGTMWLMVALMACVALAFGVYMVSHSLLGAAVAMLVIMAVLVAIKLIPFWMVFIMLVVVVGMGVSRRQVAA